MNSIPIRKSLRDSQLRKAFIGVTKGEQPFFKAVADRYATDPDWQVHQVDCGHDVMIDKPDELTAILESSI